MYLVNYHLHSNCSPDGGATMSEMAAAAYEKGIKEICFTDHCDFIGLHGQLNDSFSWEPILRQYETAKAEFDGLVTIKLGIELGGAVHTRQLADEVLAQPGLDFVIGSIHTHGFGQDFYTMRHTDAEKSYRVLDVYMAELLELAQTDYYDVLGHLTYPLRYMRSRDGVNVSFDRYTDKLREIFARVIERGKGIEINTSGYRTNKGEPMPSEDILSLYKDCGGYIISIGTDAHHPSRVDEKLLEGYEVLKRLGFEKLAVYSGRKPEFIDL